MRSYGTHPQGKPSLGERRGDISCQLHCGHEQRCRYAREDGVLEVLFDHLGISHYLADEQECEERRKGSA